MGRTRMLGHVRSSFQWAALAGLALTLAETPPARADNEPTAVCRQDERILDKVRDWLCAQDFSGDWTDESGSACTQSIHFARDGNVRISITRNDTRRRVGGGDFRWVVEDHMVENMDEGLGSIDLFVLASVPTRQRDGSARNVDTWKGFRVATGWSGFETKYTDTDDFLNVEFDEMPAGDGPPFPVDFGGGRLFASFPATPATKATFDSLLQARHLCFLQRAVESEEYTKFCVGDYVAPKQPLIGVTTDVALHLDARGTAQLDVASGGPELPALHFAGWLSDARRVRSDGVSLPYVEDNMAGGEYFQPSRTLYLSFLDESRVHWLEVACSYDDKARVRLVHYVVNHVEKGRWEPDRFWWQDRVNRTGMVEAH